MKLLVTGASGFIGRALAQRLLLDPTLAELRLLDVTAAQAGDPRIRVIVSQ